MELDLDQSYRLQHITARGRLYKSLFLYLKLRTINCQTGYSQEADGRVFTHTITHFPLTHTHTESLFNEFESRGGLLSMK